MDEKLTSKLKKLLALSKSPNPHEAALALEKAQKFMEENGLCQDDVDLLDIGETLADSILSSAAAPPEYMGWLLTVITLAMGCKSLYGREKVVFVGAAARCEIAAYMYDVLARQLRKQRRDFIRSLSKRTLPKNRTAKADAFCEGWCLGVQSRVQAMKLSTNEKALIEKFKETTYPSNSDLKLRQSKRCSGQSDASNAGWKAGREARLDRGVSGSSGPEGIGRTRQIGAQ